MRESELKCFFTNFKLLPYSRSHFLPTTALQEGYCLLPAFMDGLTEVWRDPVMSSVAQQGWDSRRLEARLLTPRPDLPLEFLLFYVHPH